MVKYQNKLEKLPKRTAPIKIKTSKVNFIVGDIYCPVDKKYCCMGGFGCISTCVYNQPEEE